MPWPTSPRTPSDAPTGNPAEYALKQRNDEQLRSERTTDTAAEARSSRNMPAAQNCGQRTEITGSTIWIGSDYLIGTTTAAPTAVSPPTT